MHQRRMEPEAVLADLPSRIESVRKSVPPLRRVQVVRDLCLVARADGHATEAEVQVICEIAAAVEVDLSVVTAGFDLGNAACGCEIRGEASGGHRGSTNRRGT